MLLAAVAAAVVIAVWTRTRATRPTAPAPIARPPPPRRPPAPRPVARPARDPDPPGTLRLEGLVLDERDQPVPGAAVELASRPPRTVATDADGSFAIDGLLPTAYQVTAWKDDRYAAPVWLVVRAATEPLVLRLVRGATLAVRVVDDATDAPVAGATIDDGRQALAAGAAGAAALRPGPTLLQRGGPRRRLRAGDDRALAGRRSGRHDRHAVRLARQRGPGPRGRPRRSPGGRRGGGRARRGRRRRVTTDAAGAWTIRGWPLAATLGVEAPAGVGRSRSSSTAPPRGATW
jgi:hypothetical protein